jgi:hypothetical protein
MTTPLNLSVPSKNKKGKAFSAYFVIHPINGMDIYVPRGSTNQIKNMMYHGGRRLTKAAIATQHWLQTSNQGNGGQG